MTTGLPKSAVSALAPAAATSAAATPARARSGSRRLGPVDSLLLLAVIGLVCLVSLPRIEDYARRTNERDARHTLSMLAELAFPAPAVAVDGRGLSRRVADDRRLSHRLRDARAVPGTEVLLYHGYYFVLARLASGEPRVVAWPRRAGRTGEPAYAWSFDSGLLVHANADGRFGGLAARPRFDGAAGEWRPVEVE